MDGRKKRRVDETPKVVKEEESPFYEGVTVTDAQYEETNGGYKKVPPSKPSDADLYKLGNVLNIGVSNASLHS